LARAIEDKIGVKAELKKSGGGVFEVFIDDKKIFSKKESGRFPDQDEILSQVG
jgi:selenoprotein W-related protein